MNPLPIDAAISDRLMGATLRRAIIRAYMADELTITEIAAEFGCHESYARRVTAQMRQTRMRVRRRECGRRPTSVKP